MPTDAASSSIRLCRLAEAIASLPPSSMIFRLLGEFGQVAVVRPQPGQFGENRDRAPGLGSLALDKVDASRQPFDFAAQLLRFGGRLATGRDLALGPGDCRRLAGERRDHRSK